MARALHLIAANLWCWGAMLAVSAMALLIAPLWLVGGRLGGWSWTRAVREGTWVYARLCLMALRPFVDIRVRGEAPAMEQIPAILVMNHQSWLDLYLMAASPISRNTCILIRAWPFKRLFFFRPLMRLAAHVPTEGADMETILGGCRRELAGGASILGYPEGTRSLNGNLGRFHSGLFRLALELDRPLVPVIVKHSGRIIPKGSLFFRPGRIEMDFDKPIHARGFAGENIPHGALRRHVRRRFQDVLTAI